MLEKFSGLNRTGPYLSLEKEKETFCVVFTYSVKLAHVTVVQQQLKNMQKSVMNVQSCCFTTINLLLFLPFSLPSTSLLAKLPFVVIQKFCYHGNVTSHFSSLLDAGQTCCLIYKQAKELGKERRVLGSEHWRRLILSQTWLASLRVDSTELVDQVSDACVLAYQGRRQFNLVTIIKKLQLGDGVCAHLGLHLTKDKESIRLHLGSYLFQYFLYHIIHRIVEIKWNMVWIENYCAMRMDTEISLISSPDWFIRAGFRFKHVHAF